MRRTVVCVGVVFALGGVSACGGSEASGPDPDDAATIDAPFDALAADGVIDATIDSPIDSLIDSSIDTAVDARDGGAEADAVADTRDATAADADGAIDATPEVADAHDAADARPDTGFDARPGDGCTADAVPYQAIWCRSFPTTRTYSVASVGPLGETIVASDSVSAVDADGAALWSYVPPAKSPFVAIDPTGAFSTAAPMYVAGALDGLSVIERRDRTSAVVWTKSFPGDPFTGKPLEIRGLAVDGLGRTIVAGRLLRAVDFGAEAMPPGGFVVSFEPDGRVRWARALGGDLHELAIRTAPGGDVVLEGTMSGPIDVGAAAPLASVDTKSGDRVFVRWHDDGAFVWSKQYLAEGNFGWQSTLAVSPIDGRLVSFYSPYGSGPQWMLTALDAAGGELWRKPVVSTPASTASGFRAGSLGFDPLGALHVSGDEPFPAPYTVDFGGGPIGSRDGFVVDLAADGTFSSQVFGAGAPGSVTMQEFDGLGSAPDGSLRVLRRDAVLMKLPARH